MKNVLKPLTQAEVYTSTRYKVNPKTGDLLEVVTASRPVFKAIASAEPISAPGRARKGPKPAGGEDDGRAARRAKKALYDLAICNDFDMFFTLTLSPDKIDRYDYKTAVRMFGQWMDNRVRRKGLRYVAVPERHKDGAIHFHGLCNSDACKLVDSKRRDKKGRKVYNLSDWTLGFTTAVFLDEHYHQVCQYVSKYITKQTGGGTIGGRYYYHGGALLTPIYRYSNEPAPDDALAYEVPDAGLTLFYWPLEGGDVDG